jgi:hypothetical protein
LKQLKEVRRVAEGSLLLLGAVAALSCWRLTPILAQTPADSSAASIDGADLVGSDDPADVTGGVGGTTDQQASGSAGDQASKSDATGQSSAGATTSQPSTSSESNPSSTAGSPHEMHVNPLTGLVSTPASNYEPLTGDERLKIYFKMNYWSVGAYFGPVLTALVLDQATNSPEQWGGGFRGFGRRVASRVGNAVLQGTVQAPVAAVFHEDVRYITSNQPGIKSRIWHAVKYSFLTYNDQGRPTLNVANIGAYYASTAISVAWLPGHYNVASYTLSNSTEQIALSVPVNVFQEFWPEIRHFVFRRH